MKLTKPQIQKVKENLISLRSNTDSDLSSLAIRTLYLASTYHDGPGAEETPPSNPAIRNNIIWSTQEVAVETWLAFGVILEKHSLANNMTAHTASEEIQKLQANETGDDAIDKAAASAVKAVSLFHELLALSLHENMLFETGMPKQNDDPNNLSMSVAFSPINYEASQTSWFRQINKEFGRDIDINFYVTAHMTENQYKAMFGEEDMTESLGILLEHAEGPGIYSVETAYEKVGEIAEYISNAAHKQYKPRPYDEMNTSAFYALLKVSAATTDLDWDLQRDVVDEQFVAKNKNLIEKFLTEVPN